MLISKVVGLIFLTITKVVDVVRLIPGLRRSSNKITLKNYSSTYTQRVRDFLLARKKEIDKLDSEKIKDIDEEEEEEENTDASEEGIDSNEEFDENQNITQQDSVYHSQKEKEE